MFKRFLVIVENDIPEEAFRELDRSDSPVPFVSMVFLLQISIRYFELNLVVEWAWRVLEFANLLWLYSLNQFWYIIIYICDDFESLM